MKICCSIGNLEQNGAEKSPGTIFLKKLLNNTACLVTFHMRKKSRHDKKEYFCYM
jgi:hypothetical protein